MLEFKIQPLFTIQPGIHSGKGHMVKFVVPMPKFEPGYNYDEDRCILNAKTDWEAVLEFFSQYDTEHTVRSYVSEIEKFILWLIREKQMPLSGLKRGDWDDYIHFLENVPEQYCGQRVVRFASGGVANCEWRPFLSGTVGLSPGSIRKAIKIVEALFSFLVEAGYLKASPVISKRKRTASSSERAFVVAERFIPEDLLDLVIDSLYELIGSQAMRKADSDLNTSVTALLRAKFIVQLIRDLGLRASELVAVRMSDFKITKNSWRLRVNGKGNKNRLIRVPDHLRDTIIEERIRNGLPPYPLVNENVPLVGQLKNKSLPITTRRLGQIIHETFCMVATNLEHDASNHSSSSTECGETMRSASLLREASTHWLRHSHATEHLKASGNNLKSTMQRLGHASVQTTMIYVHVLEDDDPTTAD